MEKIYKNRYVYEKISNETKERINNKIIRIYNFNPNRYELFTKHIGFILGSATIKNSVL